MTAMPRVTMSAPVLLEESDRGVLRLTLNRPDARNALSAALMLELLDALARVAEDPQARVVVIAGAGPAFCAGHDLREIRADQRRETYERVFALCSELMLAIVGLPKPVIAEVHGVATAAGCQLVATCDLAVAAEDARFATPGVNIGLFCSTPMVALTRAVLASINLPVSSISIAALRPTARVSATIGVEQKRPILTPGVANRASSAATARSQVATSWQPAAVATP